MKKAFLLLTVLMALLSALALSASAATAIGEVKVPYATTAPTLDGVLSDGEWTGAKTVFGKDTAVIVKSYAAIFEAANFTFPFSVDCYYAWDETNFYIALEMHGQDMWYVAGNKGDHIRLYIDPANILADYCTAQNKDTAATMPRISTGVAADGKGVWVAENLGTGVSNVALEKGVTVSENGWVTEIAVPWTVISQSMTAKVGAETTVTPVAGMAINANYDFHHYMNASAFLTTCIAQAESDAVIWNLPKHTDMKLVLQAEAQEEVPSDPETPGDDANPGTGIEMVAPVVICAAAAAACVALTKKKH